MDNSSLFLLVMPLAVLPEKNTFIHFQDGRVPFSRSATEPGKRIPLGSNVWTPPGASSWDVDGAMMDGQGPQNIVPLAPSTLMPQTCEVADTDACRSNYCVSAWAPWAKVPVTREPNILQGSAFPATPSTIPNSDEEAWDVMRELQEAVVDFQEESAFPPTPLLAPRNNDEASDDKESAAVPSLSTAPSTVPRSGNEASDEEKSPTIPCGEKRRWVDLADDDDDESPIFRAIGAIPFSILFGKATSGEVNDTEQSPVDPEAEDEDNKHKALDIAVPSCNRPVVVVPSPRKSDSSLSLRRPQFRAYK